MNYHVKLSDLKLQASIGINDEEYQNPQPIIVSLDLSAQKPIDTEFKSINDCINYAPIYDKIHELKLTEGHIDLLEQLAVKIIDICFEQDHVEHCRVTITKPNVFKGEAMPSITLERSRR